MKLEKELKAYKNQIEHTVEEKKLRETIQKTKEVFILQEQKYAVSHLEFLINQFHLIRKRWWIFQALLLSMSAVLLPYMESKFYTTRSLGLIGVLFVVLIIPEFWKNKSAGCMQVEAACFFSLRQIYAARMFLFGIVDFGLLTVFCSVMSGKAHFALFELMVDFLFPAMVAACICFGTLYSNTMTSEGPAIIFCLLWSAVWWEVVRNEAVYKLITVPMWCVLFGIAVAVFIGAVYKTLHDCNKIWEVEISGITIS